MKWIEKEHLKRDMKWFCWNLNHLPKYEDICRCIDAQKTIVRCRECKHYFGRICIWHSGFMPDETWFCADGERKEK